MQRRKLGSTGIEVSRLVFGTGTTDPRLGRMLQMDLPAGELERLLVRAYDLGVTWWDTATTYGTHRQVGRALRQVGRQRVVVTTKMRAPSAAGMRAELERTLAELGTDYVDVALVHCVESATDWRRRESALEELWRARREGLVRAVGMSSHGLGATRAAVADPRVEVLLLRVNPEGMLMDTLEGEAEGLPQRLVRWAMASRSAYRLFTLVPKGVRNLGVRTFLERRGAPIAPGPERDETLDLMARAHAAGQGVYAMKVLGEGRLAHRAEECLAYALGLPAVDAVMVGMGSEAEVCQNVALVERLDSAPALSPGRK